MNYSYKFPAIKGIQAGREYYVTMVPLKFLSKLFPSDDDIVQPEFRAQRRINEARIPDIRDYIINNRNSYVFSALSASIDGDFTFKELSNGAGVIEIDMDSMFLINDGQHRRAAIDEAIKQDQSLLDETIAIVLFKDTGLSNSQQMFTDLNKHAVKTSNSLSTLYDYRDEIAVATKKIINNNEFFRKYTDKERDILGKNSSNLFTLNTLYKANQKIIHGNSCGDNEYVFIEKYWNLVTKNIIEWQDVMSKTLTKKSLREEYIITLGITLNALGKVGRYFFDNPNVKMEKYLNKLSEIDWLRSNPEWIGRAIRENGKVQNSEDAVAMTSIYIKKCIGVALQKDEEQKEKSLMEFRKWNTTTN